MYNLKETGVITKLKSLVSKRFKDKEKLERHLTLEMGSFITLELSSYCDKDDKDYYGHKELDYCYQGCMKMNEEEYCYIDIYFLKTRNNKIYITGIGYDFE